jgi:nitrite reductase (NADH) small subunit
MIMRRRARTAARAEKDIEAGSVSQAEGASTGGASGFASVNLGPLDRIPVGEGRNYRLGDEEIAVFRTRAAEVFAVQAECPHRGGPLADGLLGEKRVYCPLHSYAFDLVTGEAVRNSCPALRTYPVTLTEAGEIVVSGVGELAGSTAECPA